MIIVRTDAVENRAYGICAASVLSALRTPHATTANYENVLYERYLINIESI